MDDHERYAEGPSIETFFDEQGIQPGEKKKKMPSQKPFGWRLLSFLLTLALCFAAVFLITQFVLQRNTVVGHSMVPTLNDKDEIFVEKISRIFPAWLKRGDIVTADTYKTPRDDQEIVVIKRIIGMPGEHVEIRDGAVLINGKILDEAYLPQGTMTSEHTLEYADCYLGDSEYYLMGDNRINSRDSRDFGPVDRSDIEGRLLLRFYPLDKFGKPR